MERIPHCYCEQCRRPLALARSVDPKFAWCPYCKTVVSTARLQVKPWVLGAVFVVAGNFFFRLCG